MSKEKFAVPLRKSKLSLNSRDVALDLDGILLDGMPFHIRAWQLAFKRYDFQPEVAQLYRLEGIPTREVVNIICSPNRLRLSVQQRDDVVAAKKRIYHAIFEPAPLSVPRAQPLYRVTARWP